MIASLLIALGAHSDADAALDSFAQLRSAKQCGVGSPSQRRYVAYYASLHARAPSVITPKRLWLDRITVAHINRK